MKVGTLTFHGADNYGAILQAYALQKAIVALGYDCEIIDFFIPELFSGTDLEWPKDIISKYGIARGVIKSVNRWRMGCFSKRNKRANFSRFYKDYLHKSEKRYYTLSDLYNVEYDVIMFGSDQIWNKKITEHATDLYLGEFKTKKNIRRVSYAASNGTDRIPEELDDTFKHGLERFYRISTREKTLSKYISNQYRLNSQDVLDPVFLLSKSDWKTIEGKLPYGIKKGKYIFVYTFDDQTTYQLARELSSKMDLPLVVLRWCGKSKRLTDMKQLFVNPPNDFISLIANAALVCTSSFHGTAFSIIFEKDLYSVVPELLGQRISDTVKQIGDPQKIQYNGSIVYHCNKEYYQTNNLRKLIA